MVADAEKYKAEDDLMAKKIEAKNGLENYCFQMKNTLNEEKLKSEFTDEEKKNIEDWPLKVSNGSRVTPRPMVTPWTVRRRSSKANSTQ